MTYAIISDWVTLADAKQMMNDLIGREIYTKEQLKKSSTIFANGKDKSDGYLYRVMAIEGIHPDMERGSQKRRVKRETVESTPRYAPKPGEKAILIKELVVEDGAIPIDGVIGMPEWNTKWNQATRDRKITKRVLELFGNEAGFNGWELVK